MSSIVPGTNGTNGDKKARLDPTCGTLVFCGATDFANMLKPGKLKEVFWARNPVTSPEALKSWNLKWSLGRCRTIYTSRIIFQESYHSKHNVHEPMLLAALKDVRIRHVGKSRFFSWWPGVQNYMLIFPGYMGGMLDVDCFQRSRGRTSGGSGWRWSGKEKTPFLDFFYKKELYHQCSFIGLGLGQQWPWSAWPWWHQMQVLNFFYFSSSRFPNYLVDLLKLI